MSFFYIGLIPKKKFHLKSVFGRKQDFGIKKKKFIIVDHYVGYICITSLHRTLLGKYLSDSNPLSFFSLSRFFFLSSSCLQINSELLLLITSRYAILIIHFLVFFNKKLYFSCINCDTILDMTLSANLTIDEKYSSIIQKEAQTC